MKKIAAILTIALCLPLTSCDTLQAVQSKPGVQFAEMEAIKLTQAFFSNGGSVDSAWGISNGLNLIGDVTTFAIQQKRATSEAQASALAAAAVKAQVKAFAGDQTAVNGLATGVANIVSAAKTPAEKAKVTLAVAAGIQSAATFDVP